MENNSACLSEDSLPNNANSQNVSEIIEATGNLQLSCNQTSPKDMEESKPYELPPELWTQIFRYLSHYQLFKTIRLVCPKWREIVDCALGPDFWRVVEFKLADIKYPFLLYVSARSNNIQSLTLSGCSVSSLGLILALKQMPSLKKLSLDFCYWFNVGGDKIVPDEISTHEQFMSWLMNQTVEDKNVASMSTYNQYKRYLARKNVPDEISTFEQYMSFVMDPNVSDEILAQAMSLLINHNVRRPFRSIKNGGLSSLTLAAIGRHCPKLTFLDLTGQRVTYDALQVITSGCKELTHLSLKYCGMVTSSGIKVIADNCASLRELDFNVERFEQAFYCSGWYRGLAEGCPKLECITLNGIKLCGRDFADRFLSPGLFKNLTRLNLSSLETVNDDVVLGFAEHFEKLGGVPCIKHVDLHGCHVTLHCMCRECKEEVFCYYSCYRCN